MARRDDECPKCGSEDLTHCSDCGTYSLCRDCDYCSGRKCYEYKD